MFEDDNKPAIHFEGAPRSILKTHCWHCHGEETEIQASLDLRLVRFMIKGGEGGSAIQPGRPEDSLLWQKIANGEMPPTGKGLSESEKQTLYAWMQQGAATARPEPESLTNQATWTPEEKNYWAFQPIKRHPLPAVQNPSLVRNAIDHFILAKLEGKSFQLSTEADRRTLIRRLSFDLTGLPPSPESIEEFLTDEQPDAYERLVERLLASPSYGERWGRHWLDAAGYADSDGYTENDPLRPWAFRYRDYVIQSFNGDKPWSDFVTEQLAGDELVPQPYENLSADAAEKLAATGFLRMAPDGTGEAGIDPNVARNDVVAETIKIVSTSMLGLTVGCAQCHSHRYDPISQQDYYRVRAVFEPALDWKNWKEKPTRLVSLWQAAEKQKASEVDGELAQLEGTRVKELDEMVQAVFDNEVAKLPEEKRALAKPARDTPEAMRTDEQKQLLKDYPSLNVDRGSVYLYEQGKVNEFNKKYEKLQADLKSKRPAESYVACLFEAPGQAAPATHLFSRGDFNQPREIVEPGDLSVLAQPHTIPSDDPQLPTTGRRLALAKLWTNGQHPLLPRTIVNRIWLHHFGRGLSNSPGDFGALGERPSHPELLDYLAAEFVEDGWNIKNLHRRIVNSATYRQASTRSKELDHVDPENRLLGRMSLRRLEAESIRDAMIELSGKRSLEMFGPPVPVNPDDVGQAIIGSATRDGNGIMVANFDESVQQYRRTIYLQVRRSLPFGMLEPFDLANTAPNCDRRNQSTVAPQSLLLMNNRYTILYAERFAERLQREMGENLEGQIRRAWLLAFGREVSDQELARALQLTREQAAIFEQVAATPAPTDAAAIAARGTPLPPTTQAMAILCQSLFSSNRFLYID